MKGPSKKAILFNQAIRLIRLRLLLLFLFIIGNQFSCLLVEAQSTQSQDIRCSHVPPVPEQITHVWLGDVNFNETSTDDEQLLSEQESEARNAIQKNKRHINQSKNVTPLLDSSPNNHNNGAGNSMWALFKPKSAQLSSSRVDDDIVPIKIQIHYDSSVSLLDKQKLLLINGTVMPSVVSFFENVLSIKRKDKIDTFKMARRCPNNTIYYARDARDGFPRPYCMNRCEDYAICGEVVVPKNHLAACSYCNSTSKRCHTNHSSEGEGVPDAQLVLYVSAKQTARCKKDQTIAYAAHCAQDTRTDRPVAGHANLCPASISVDPKDLKALIATVKHELTHVLGFSVSLFAYYRDEHGQPLTERDSLYGPIAADPITGYAKWSDRIIKKIVRSDWVTGEGKVDKEVHVIVTPTVVREARNHFNCSTLEGAELEDQGFDGTSMTHWEKRLFENEAMTGTHTQNSVYSRLTLAVLQDTGWYVANFTKAENLEWGKELGCNFAKKSCKSWIDERRSEGKSIRPFCDKVKGELLQIACTEDRTSKAVCNMKQYKDPLPLAYQNFEHLDGVTRDDLAFYGGSVDLADYCPFIQEFTWQTQNITVRGSRCESGGNNHETDRNAALEYYGPQTRCFEHGRRWEQRSCSYKRHWHHYGAGCYKYTCSNGHISVMIGNHSYPCYYPNQMVRVEQLVDQWLYNGTIVCPACEKVCPIHKCKTFDKHSIEKLLKLYSELNNTGDLPLKDVMKHSFINSIETGDDFTSNDADDSTLNESSYKTSNKFKEKIKFKEDLLNLLNQHTEPPRQRLLCSGGSKEMQIYTNLMIFSIIINILRQLLNYHHDAINY